MANKFFTAQEILSKAPDLPYIETIEDVNIGDSVKLFFGESPLPSFLDCIWVTVIDIKGNQVIGTVCSAPAKIIDIYKDGSNVYFELNNICARRDKDFVLQSYKLVSSMHIPNSPEYLSKLKSLRVGDYLKIMLSNTGVLNEGFSERVWVLITGINEYNYTGSIANGVILFSNMKEGDQVEFSQDYIWDVLLKED